MKKFITIVVCVLMASVSLLAQDIIVTTDAQKIEAKILEVSKSDIKYKEKGNMDGPTFVLETKEISSIIYANGKVVLYGKSKELSKDGTTSQPSQTIDESTAEIRLLSGEIITAQISSLGKDIITYTIDGQYCTIAASKVETVTLLKNGQVKTYNSNQPSFSNSSSSTSTSSASRTTLEATNTEASPQSIQIVDKNVTKSEINPVVHNDHSLAKVENYSGVYVFTDCTPIAKYEILGEVYFDKEGPRHVSVLPSYGVSPQGTLHVTGSHVISYTETPQYNEIRNGLVTQAILANRQVEGIIVFIPRSGEGRAILIKFSEGEENKSLAKVSSHLGVLVFTDCMPANTYSFVGNIPKAGGLDSNYSNLRDKLIQKAQKKFPSLQGVIIHLVTGGNDSAEAIKF